MSLGLVTACYLAAAVLFILALGGLSNQEKAKRAIWYGMIGMALAVIATIFGGSGHYWLLAPMVIIGGVVGGASWYMYRLAMGPNGACCLFVRFVVADLGVGRAM